MLVEVGLLVQTCLHSAVPAGASRSLGEPRAGVVETREEAAQGALGPHVLADPT